MLTPHRSPTSREAEEACLFPRVHSAWDRPGYSRSCQTEICSGLGQTRTSDIPNQLSCQRTTALKVSQEVLAFNELTVTIHAVSKPLSSAGEEELGFTDWFQAWKWLSKLIAEFLPKEHCAWMSHLDRIHLKDGISNHWSLWLAYDIEVQCCACVSGLDPVEFHYLWNELEPKFIVRQAEALLECFGSAPSQRNLTFPTRAKRESSPG